MARRAQLPPDAVRFTEVAGTPAAGKALARERCVLEFRRLRKLRRSRAEALQAACQAAAGDGFGFSPGRLREWLRRYRRHGLDGLVDQYRGHSGRRSVWAQMSLAQRAAVVSGRVVFGAFAPAFRALGRRSDLSPVVRRHVQLAVRFTPRSVRRQGAQALARVIQLSQPPARSAGRRSWVTGRRRSRRGPSGRRPCSPVPGPLPSTTPQTHCP